MSRRNHTHVDAMRAATSETFELLLLQHPQQFRLQRQRNIPYLIEEQCPFVGHFETPNFLRESSGESAFLMAKEFALQQIKRNGGTVQPYEGVSSARADIVNGVRDELLPSSGLAFDESSAISGRDHPNQVEYLSKRPACSDDALKPVVRGCTLHCLTASRCDS